MTNKNIGIGPKPYRSSST